MERMKACVFLFALAAFALSAAEKTETIEGKLIVRSGEAATLEVAGQKPVALDGDATTRKVLRDERINGFTVQATGHFASGKFVIEGRGLLVHKHDKLQAITYWCDVCELRSYTPGPCACCEKETALDLRDPEVKH